MVLTGLWHGAAWNFIIWGLYYGFILTMEKMFLGSILVGFGSHFNIYIPCFCDGWLVDF